MWALGWFSLIASDQGGCKQRGDPHMATVHSDILHSDTFGTVWGTCTQVIHSLTQTCFMGHIISKVELD